MAVFNPNFETIGQAFIEHYYKSFDLPDINVRAQALSMLYDVSLSIYQGQFV